VAKPRAEPTMVAMLFQASAGRGPQTLSATGVGAPSSRSSAQGLGALPACPSMWSELRRAHTKLIKQPAAADAAGDRCPGVGRAALSASPSMWFELQHLRERVLAMSITSASAAGAATPTGARQVRMSRITTGAYCTIQQCSKVGGCAAART